MISLDIQGRSLEYDFHGNVLLWCSFHVTGAHLPWQEHQGSSTSTCSCSALQLQILTRGASSDLLSFTHKTVLAAVKRGRLQPHARLLGGLILLLWDSLYNHETHRLCWSIAIRLLH